MNVKPVRIPVEVQSPVPVFDVVARGYDLDQVHSYVSHLEQELAELRWEMQFTETRQAEIAKAQEQLDLECARFEQERDAWRPTWTALGDRAAELLSHVQEATEKLRRRTTEECTTERRRTAEECTALRRAAAKETESLRKAANRALAVARSETDRMRALAQEDLIRKRRDAQLEATAIVNQAKVQAEELIATARRTAATVESRAQEQLGVIRRQRETIGAQLTELNGRVKAAVENFLSSDPDKACCAPSRDTPGRPGHDTASLESSPSTAPVPVSRYPFPAPKA